VAAYVGLVNYTDRNSTSGDRELELARIARSLTDLHGGRFLSIYWTKGDVDIVLAYEGRDEAQAMKVFNALKEQDGIDLRVMQALTEGEKERDVQGKR
jgi:uncharacterized protein with GYD domain